MVAPDRTKQLEDDFKFIVWPHAQYIDGWMDKTELLTLWTLADSLQPGSLIVEIGAWCGRTSVVLALSGHDLISIDPFDCSGDDPEYVRDHDFKPLLEWKKNIKALNLANDSAMSVAQTSQDAFKWWTRKIDMLVIDGDHSYEAVSRDLRSWANCFLKQGGILVLDDVHPEGQGDRWEGVGRAAREYLAVWERLYTTPLSLGKLLITRKVTK